jgi:hypothetical protein
VALFNRGMTNPALCEPEIDDPATEEVPVASARGGGGRDGVRHIEARRPGLAHRPIGDIVRGTRRWDSTRSAGRPLAAGMNAELERSLLHRWRKRAGR